MSLSAARSDLTISVVGEDETQAMLAQAQANMAALEGRIKSLTAAGKAQETQAGTQVSALGRVNTSMAGGAKMAEGLVMGLDRSKAAFEKVIGAVGFAGIAITGLVALGSEVIAMFGDMQSEADKLDVELKANAASADTFAKSMRDMSSAIAGAVTSQFALEGGLANLRAKLADLQGDAAGAEFERRMASQLQVSEEIIAKEKAANEARAAQSKAIEQTTAAQAELLALVSRETKFAAELERETMDLKLQGKSANTEELAIKGQIVQRTREQIRDAREILATAQTQTGQLDRQVSALSEQKSLLSQIQAAMKGQIFADPSAKKTEPKRSGGGGGRRDTSIDRAVAAAQIQVDAAMSELEAYRQEIELEEDIAAEMAEMADRTKSRAEKAKAEADKAVKAAMERAEEFRRMETQPVYDFADALTGSLVPALSEVAAVMSEVTAIFDKYRDGQIGVAEAVGMGATAIIAAGAKAIGGVKAEAAVRAVYEGAMGFATLANPVISAGHFTAAAMLTGVATGVIGSGSGGGGGGKQRGIGKPENTQQNESTGRDERKTIVINTMFGDRQSIARGIGQAERSTRGTGYTRGVGV